MIKKKNHDRKRPEAGQRYSVNRRSQNAEESHRSQAAVRRSRKQARKVLAFRLEALVVMTLFVVVGFQSLRLSSNPVINISQKNFSDESATAIENEIRTEAKEILESSIKNRIKPYVPREALVGSLEGMPEVKSVGVSLNRSAPRPILTVELQNIAMLYRAGGVSYYLTVSGEAIEASTRSIVDNGESLPLLNDVVSRSLPEDSPNRVIAPGSVGQILGLTKLIEESGQGIEVSSYEINQNPNELIVRLEGESYYLKLLLGGTFEEQGAAVVAFLRASAQGEVATPAEYIDARLVSRIVYR